MRILVILAIVLCSSTALGQEKPDFDTQQILCLARNIFFEARGEGSYGRLAVGAVTLNRVEKSGQSVCYEVYKPHQFTWTKELSEWTQVNKIEKEYETWQEILDLATDLYHDPRYKEKAGIGDRDHYLNPEVTVNRYGRLPRWYRKYSENPVRIGRHVFVEVASL